MRLEGALSSLFAPRVVQPMTKHEAVQLCLGELKGALYSLGYVM